MASTRLADAVGYPGSSVAFAQLLSGMERDRLILREVRGKRTYRINLAPGVAPGRSRPADARAVSSLTEGAGAPAPPPVPAIIGLPGHPSPEFDYDELARRLLLQVIRRLATPPEGGEGFVADLERELAAARSRASALTAENRRLREQLSQAQVSLDRARHTLEGSAIGLAEEPAPDRVGPVGEELSDTEVVLLARLVSATADAAMADKEVQPGATAS